MNEVTARSIVSGAGYTEGSLLAKLERHPAHIK